MGMGKKGTSADDPDKFFATISNEDLGVVLAEIYRVLKDNRHAYVMCDNLTLPYFYYYTGFRFPCEPCIYADSGGVVAFQNIKPLVWDKVSMGMGYHYRCRYEFIVMLDKGKNRRLNDLSKPDVLTFKRVEGKARLVPTQKPLRLFQLLVSQSTEPGEVVLDPFMGSGTTGVACVLEGRSFIGMDIEKHCLDIARKRIKEAQLQMTLL